MSSTHFDIAIIGAGAAGLHLALAMMDEPYFGQKRILIIEKSAKDSNDRTFCFWEKGDGKWENILKKTWSKSDFFTPNQAIEFNLFPYTYKMLSALDFYEFAKNKINSHPIFQWQQDDVISVNDGPVFQINGQQGTYTATYVFDSRIPDDFFKSGDQYTRLLQHFKGWVIRTPHDYFNPDTFTIMDFRLQWPQSTSFTYVLPLNTREALVEFTLFSPELIDAAGYDNMLKRYVNEILHIDEFEVLDQEQGIIPMSDFPFENYSTNKHVRIGTAGGWVKPSTGFSFKNCERNAQKIVNNLKSEKDANMGLISPKFRLYDSLFLDILYRKNEQGPALFELMYSKNSVQRIFSFLDDQTNFIQDVMIMAKFHWRPFLYSLMKRFTR